MKMIGQLLQHSDVSLSALAEGIEVNNPATGETLAYVKKTAARALDALIERAAAAQKSWAAKTALERADILWCWYRSLKDNKENLARLITMEQGKSLAESRGEMDYAASFIRWFAEEARRIDGDILTGVKPNQKIMVIKQPIGVTAAITPWNFPAAMITRKAAPALAAGCAMLVKPAALTPLSAYALATLAYRAGIPKDLFAIVSGSASEIGGVFARNETIRKISFTGSTEVGAKIFADSAAQIKKLSLELGGNAPFLVFDDADLDKAVEGVLASKFRNSGQTCVCTNRVYVQAGIYDEFCRRLSEKTAALKLGNGLEDGVNQGPLIEEKAVEKVEEHIADALKKGAVCLVGGKRSSLGGTFFEPTVLRDVTAGMRVACEETFGPLCPVFKFDSEEEAVAAANNTEFGLAGYFFTRDTARQWRVGEALEYGMVGINTGLISNEVAPFGGIKMSGLGREGSKYGVNEYLELKYLCLDLA
ncbi:MULTISPECIES: NAD-dependent succinate-semialdehyde dehydrogenase [Neisseria]|uniref:Succinate-semialdehyde dehydrogenase family protein n=1 Tax=Neisseria musculi TaxID=1815583 RepID=A0A7H1MB02_9NEIS|nr:MULTISPECIES: NAD-dependent succinate-semialdehyde dehydrogenase [Neisseria]MBF0803402.1 NAD-dependent succinate-semialdehyde dehydrogenase [Neisseria sp. 19428wB4_WF04]QNT58817.1 succinate-semialdehyde dehydrogenase family protein [Neisseria musculi]TFU43912.1 NAD-dependent succinate-semialdehyde dehydrogenase [Neisseria sp. WF04]